MTLVAVDSGEVSNAEILLWQGRYRRTFVLLLGLGTVALEWAGVISNESILARQVGTDWAMMACIGLILGYIAFNQVLIIVVRRRGHAGAGHVLAALSADLVLILTLLYAGTPPSQYARALVISIFTVQFTQLYFGSRFTAFNLGGVALGYSALTLIAMRAGSGIDAAEQFWNLALYLVGMILFVVLQGQMATRLKRIIQVFERVQEGDFSIQYDETHDEMPDAITAVGRAYNRMRSHLEAIVLTDPLSGCFNRRGFEQLCRREVSRAMRGAQSLSVLALDVDHFKKINDEFGHLTGDEVLREMGALLRESARLGDVVARIGGEEFVVLAPNTTADGAQILAERILIAFRTRNFASVGGKVRLTVSIGMAAGVARNDQIAKDVAARADEALYAAKRNGRDRMELWAPAMLGLDNTGPGSRRSLEMNAIADS